MFSNNEKISIRQTFRLFFFHLIGISTLLLPNVLAKTAGCDGIFCIAFGTLLCLFYVWILQIARKNMKTDFFCYVKKHFPKFWSKLLSFWFFAQSCWIAGFIAFIFADVIRKNLLIEESYWLILALILVWGMFGIFLGIEGRARIYEVLFWLLLIPLFIMLGGAVTGVDVDYWTPIFMSSGTSVIQGTYEVFLCFSGVSFMLFFQAATTSTEKTVSGAVKKAVLFAGILLEAFYLILIGTFGSKAIQTIEYPAITIMSTVQIVGGFLKRADALMLGIWFFTLFALLCSNLYYGTVAFSNVWKIKGNKIIPVFVTIIAAIGASLFYLYANSIQVFLRYYAWLGMPIFLLLSIVLSIDGKRRNGNA